VDPETVKRHLTAARDSLSQLTQLPAAAQLTGDARTQVSQLISNFNELITTNTEWRASYAKVQANLTALVGDQRTDESPAPTAGTAGAVGTSGTTALDPAIKAKLVEFKAHLAEFEKAAGGTTASPSASSSSAAPATPAEPEPTAATPAEPTPTTPAASASAPSAMPPAAGGASAAAMRGASGTAGAVGTSGSTAATAGSAEPSAAPEQSPQTSQPGASRQTGAGSKTEAMDHIEAIEAILNGRASATGTSGRAPGASSTLDSKQIDEIKTHLAELRKVLNKSDR
jgi:hypothetical protein